MGQGCGCWKGRRREPVKRGVATAEGSAVWNIARVLFAAQITCLFACLGGDVGGLFTPTVGGLFTQTALKCESATRSRHVSAERTREKRRKVGQRGEGANRRPSPPEGRSCPPQLGLVSAAAPCRAPPFPQRPLAPARRPSPPDARPRDPLGSA